VTARTPVTKQESGGGPSLARLGPFTAFRTTMHTVRFFLPSRPKSFKTVSGVLLLAAILGGCGSSGTTAAPTSPTPAPRANGDIADTANYLTYHGTGFSLQYVEGWGILRGGGQAVRISDKDSAEVVSIVPGKTGVATLAGKDMTRFQHTLPQFHLLARRTVQLTPGAATYLQYRTLSAQDPVTGKRVPVVVDRYYVPGPGRQAIVSLSTPVGVDNVDAFRRISRSFRWK